MHTRVVLKDDSLFMFRFFFTFRFAIYAFLPCCSRAVRIGFGFFSTKPRDWLGSVAFYDLRPGNTAVSILTAPEPTWGNMMPCTSLEIQRQRPRLKAFSLPSSRTSMCCSVPSATFHVTVRWSEPYTDNTHDLLLVVHSNHSSVTNINTCCPCDTFSDIHTGIRNLLSSP